TLINDILDLSKIDSAKMELENQPFVLRHCVEEALDLLAPKAAEKRLALSYALDEEIPVHVIGDSMRLRQILVNLINNAIKFTEKGEVALRIVGSPPASEGSEPRKSWDFSFTVRDTGI